MRALALAALLVSAPLAADDAICANQSLKLTWNSAAGAVEFRAYVSLDGAGFLTHFKATQLPMSVTVDMNAVNIFKACNVSGSGTEKCLEAIYVTFDPSQCVKPPTSVMILQG